MHEGHRQRMYERLAGKGKMEDHELLEILLYSCLPRVNTNEIAHKLLDAFGSLPAVFRADIKKLQAVEGIGDKTANQILLFGKIMDRIASYQEESLPHAMNYETLSNFLAVRFQRALQEYVEIYSVKKKTGELIFCQRFTSDEPDSVSIPAKDIADFIATFNPREVILVHNHIHGSCSPSAADNAFTKRIFLYFNLCGIELLDHYIVSPMGVFSYNRHGLMDKIRAQCSAETVLRSLT